MIGLPEFDVQPLVNAMTSFADAVNASNCAMVQFGRIVSDMMQADRAALTTQQRAWYDRSMRRGGTHYETLDSVRRRWPR